MQPPKPLLERAFELARSGECEGMSDIKARLKAEGYSATEGTLNGLGLRRQLKKLCAESKRSTDA